MTRGLNYKRIGKKGSNAIIDGLFIVVALLIVALGTLFVYPTLDNVSNAIQADDSFSEESKELIESNRLDYVNIWDTAIMTMLILFWMGSLIAAFFVDSHPVFFILFIVLVVFVLFISGVATNIWDDVSETETYGSYVSEHWTYTTLIFNNLIKIMIFIVFTTGVVLYTKVRQ